MAFRATNVIPQIAYQRARSTAANLKLHSSAAITRMAASGANFAELRDLYVFLKNSDTDLGVIAATPGISAYAKAQEVDEAYDVAAEFTAMRAAIQGVLTWIGANAPTSVTALAPSAWTADGTLIATTFTVAQTAGMRTQLQNIVNAIA